VTDQKELLQQLLDKPVGPAVAPTKADPQKDFTRKIEVKGDTLVAEIADKAGHVNEGRALKYIRDEGQDPDQWEVSSWYKVEYGPLDPIFDPDDPEVIIGERPRMESVKFTFKRRPAGGAIAALTADLDAMFRDIKKHRPVNIRPTGDHGFLVLLGDMQFGKIDGDGVEGTLKRTVAALNEAANRLAWYRQRFDIGHVHIAWLGDHIEGFESQGGANVWRTPLTLNEQIRLTRRVMLHALTLFAPLAEKVTMAAVPGNHGDAVRFMGKGVTRYDDSHDTESLIAVHDAALLNPAAFGHVEFFVPETDELTVLVPVAGTLVAHAHGHHWRPGKHFDWWKGQAFNKASAMHQADLLVAGHLHHEHVDTDGWRSFIQPPAFESESTWWRHAKGTTGAPGLIVAITKDAITDIKEVVRG
jgi:hypothetical protein